MSRPKISDGDRFLAALATVEIEEDRCKECATALADALEGFNTAEGIMGLCYHLNGFLNQAPLDARAAVLAGLMRLIDPSKGNA